MNHEQEFDRQLQTLRTNHYPEAAGLSVDEFCSIIEPLQKALPPIDKLTVDLENGYLPFVIVIKNELVATEKAMPGVTKLFPHQPSDFQVIDSETIPTGMAYLLVDIDRGKETINLPPHEAMKIIRSKNRLPLTIDEGVAIITQYPEFLMKNNCFSLLASRHAGDKRVPAIWINSHKEANLGWCWDGNPHTWLGSASGKSRIGSY